MSAPDFILEDQGSIFLLTATNADAQEHIEHNVARDAIWHGKKLVGEPRYALPLALALNREGWTVRIQ